MCPLQMQLDFKILSLKKLLFYKCVKHRFHLSNFVQFSRLHAINASLWSSCNLFGIPFIFFLKSHINQWKEDGFLDE